MCVSDLSAEVSALFDTNGSCLSAEKPWLQCQVLLQVRTELGTPSAQLSSSTPLAQGEFLPLNISLP